MRKENDYPNIFNEQHFNEVIAWQWAERLYRTGEKVIGQVKSLVGSKGVTVLVQVGQLEGFLVKFAPPPPQLTQQQRIEYLKKWVGKHITVQVIEANRREKRLVLQQYNPYEELRKARAAHLFLRLKVGDVCEGTIIGFRDLGAFVNIYGGTALLHISEFAWQRINHPRDVFKIGDKVKVLILSMDQDKKRIGLSLKRLQPNPWEKVNEHYQVGQLVTGIINRVASMGVFINLEHDIEALLPVNEIPALLKINLKANFREGQAIPVRVLDIQADQWHMGVTMLTITVEERRAWAAAQKTGN